MTPVTAGAIPWYQSPVMISQVVTAITAATAFAPQVAVKVGLTDQTAITGTVTTIFGFISIVATLYGAIKRARAPVQPLTLSPASAAAHPATVAVNQTQAAMAAAGIPTAVTVQANIKATQAAKK
jgi:hypothetical protein